jgi:hypothetical protein
MRRGKAKLVFRIELQRQERLEYSMYTAVYCVASAVSISLHFSLKS